MSDGCTILVVEDDTAIRRGLVDSLTFAGYQVVECSDGSNAVSMVAETLPDLVLLDVLLPGRTGFEILEDVRQMQPTLPVIMVTAKGAEDDRVAGLSGGADDYIVKPFSPRELLARVEAVLRRSPERTSYIASLDLGGVRVDFARREVVVSADDRRQLSERETGILQYLVANRGRAVDRDELLQRVWGLNPRGITTRTVDMHIARLREKLNDTNQSFIQTVRSKGYMLADSAVIGDEA